MRGAVYDGLVQGRRPVTIPMPDADGKFKGIAVPALPWLQEDELPQVQDEPETTQEKDASTSSEHQ